MKADELFLLMKARAELAFANGEKSSEFYAQAEQQKNSGMTISADYTRLLASLVKTLEQGRLP